MTAALAKIQGSELNDPARWNAGVTATTGGKPVSQTQDIQFGGKRLPKYTVEDRGYDTPCWICVGTNLDGYGKMMRRGRWLRTHRVFYERFVGPIPEGLQLDHLCRNRACCNPDHLEPVTSRENYRRGDRTKLTAGQVAEIKARLLHESPNALAEEFGVAGPTVRDIARGKTWTDIKPATGDSA